MLYLLATPIGNIKDISLRALEVLERTHKIIAEDTRMAKDFIKLLRERGHLSNGDFSFLSLHAHNEASLQEWLNEELFNDDVIYSVDAGTPCISDPGARLISFAREKNIPFTILPGASSLICAYALSGFNGAKFTFHAFAPPKQGDRRVFLEEILHSRCINIFFESKRRLRDMLKDLDSLSESTKVFLAKEITKLNEKTYLDIPKNLLAIIKDSELRGEWVVIIDSSKINQPTKTLNKSQIQALNIAPKVKAKLLSLMEDRSIKDIYCELTALNSKELR